MGPSSCSNHLFKKKLSIRPLDVRSHPVRNLAEIAPDKSPMSKAPAFWIETMGKVGLGRDLFDIKWLDTILKVSVKNSIASSRITMFHGGDEDVLNKLKADIGMFYVTGGHVTPSPHSASHGSFWTVKIGRGVATSPSFFGRKARVCSLFKRRTIGR